MKQLFFSIIIFSLVATFFSSCETDVELLSEAQETTVIYGLLNASQETQYIRINKAFLTDGNALEFASESNEEIYFLEDGSLTYEVSMSMTDINNSNIISSWSLDTTTLIAKDTGVFYNPWQMIYYFSKGENGAPDSLKPEYSYEIIVTNRKNGEISTAETKLITPFMTKKPNYNFLNPQINFENNDNIFLSEGISWNTGENGQIYQPIIRFFFKEENGKEITEKYFDWIFQTQTAKDYSIAGEELIQSYKPVSFYANIRSSLEPVGPETTRTPMYIEVIYWAASPEYYTYMQVNNPSQSIVQERPEYTNVNNGIGLFSNRLSITKRFNIASITLTNLTNPSIVGENMGFVIPGK